MRPNRIVANWFRTVLGIVVLFGCMHVSRPCAAQAKARLLVGSCINVSISKNQDLSDEVRQVVYAELSRLLAVQNLPGADSYALIPVQEVDGTHVLPSIAQKSPSKMTYLQRLDLWRPIIKAVKADVLADIIYRTRPPKRGRPTVAVEVQFIDVVTGSLVDYSVGMANDKSAPVALRHAATQAVGECLRRRLVRTIVEERIGATIKLPIGKRSGVFVGDELTVVSEIDGVLTYVGLVKTAKVSESETIADVLSDIGGWIAKGATCTLIRVPRCTGMIAPTGSTKRF